MEDTIVFIGTVIIAITEIIRRLVPHVNGSVTIAVAGLVGLLVAVLDIFIGLPDIDIAKGIMIGLSAAGVVAVAHHTQPPVGKDVGRL